MAGFELDTDEVAAMAKALHTFPATPQPGTTAPSASAFADLADAGRWFTSRWGTGVTVMVDDVTRLATSVEQAVLTYLAADQRAGEALKPR